jgi:hypothetical protein
VSKTPPRCEDCLHFHSDTEPGHGLCGAYEIDGPAYAVVQRNAGWLMARIQGRCGWEGRWFKKKTAEWTGTE